LSYVLTTFWLTREGALLVLHCALKNDSGLYDDTTLDDLPAGCTDLLFLALDLLSDPVVPPRQDTHNKMTHCTDALTTRRDVDVNTI
jgi:hypothetical protein